MKTADTPKIAGPTTASHTFPSVSPVDFGLFELLGPGRLRIGVFQLPLPFQVFEQHEFSEGNKNEKET